MLEHIDPEFWKYVGLIFVGLLLKISWDWITTGRVSPGVYMTVKRCEVSRRTCNPILFQKEFAMHKTKVNQQIKEFDKRLDAGAKDFKTITACMSKIDKNLAILTALYKSHYGDKGGNFVDPEAIK